MMKFTVLGLTVLLCACAGRPEGARFTFGDGLGPKANIPPIMVGSCTLTAIDSCKVTIRPTIGAHPDHADSVCYIKPEELEPGALVINPSNFEIANAKILWLINSEQLPGKFAFARATAQHSGGITIYRPGNDSFSAPEEETDFAINPSVQKIRIKPLQGSKKHAYHYDIRLLYQAPNETEWKRCVVLDPVIVNRG